MSDNYVLGLNFLHSDTSSCIFKNGQLIAAVEEERFTRIKHTSVFPKNSIIFCLEEAKIDISQVNIIAINSNPFSSLIRKILFTLKNLRRLNLAFKSVQNIKKKLSIKKNILEIDKKFFFKGKIKYIDHHESHIASSLYFSKFEECVNLSIDGFGDFASCAWGVFEKNKLTIDKRIHFPHSLGIFYQAITQFLGFKNYGDEYKVMGLSSYGEPKYLKEMSKLLFNINDGFELNLNYFIHHNTNIIDNDLNGQIKYKNLYSSKLTELLGKDREGREEITQRHKDIAKSAQQIYEDVLFGLLNSLYKIYKIKNLTLSGGCAMNSVANGKILHKTPFEKIYISPNPGDAGGSVGSAISSISRLKLDYSKDINYAYLGNQYDRDEIEKIINKNKLKDNFQVNELSDEEILKKTVTFLAESNIVGWFQGRMEWGPRALGNRSILADARNPKIKDIINSKIKRRESFRPFAPSVLKDYSEEWFETNKEVPYMSEVYLVKKNKRDILPAITHVDGTGRLQTVTKDNNIKFYNLIMEFYKLTNVPIILNTSFNENEPIVKSPQEAINCFCRTNMDILVLGNWLIKRN